jgi:uncharacterized membrane protein YphA (DoxX/SURF4 family)
VEQFFCNLLDGSYSNLINKITFMATVKQLQSTLRLTYGIVPIVAGLDKFTNLLTQWVDYLGNNKSMLPLDPLVFMKIVGVIEIIAGIIVLVRPLIGAYIVMIWLICIALQLIIGGHYFDVAVRDLVMAIGAYTLAQLTKMEEAGGRR